MHRLILKTEALQFLFLVKMRKKNSLNVSLLILKTFSFSVSCCCSLSAPPCLTEAWLILFLPLHCYLEGIYRVWSCSLLCLSFQLWINQASSDFPHVSYLSQGHANCNSKPRKALPVGEDTSELMKLLHRLFKKLRMDSLCPLPGLCACGFACTCVHWKGEFICFQTI